MPTTTLNKLAVNPHKIEEWAEAGTAFKAGEFSGFEGASGGTGLLYPEWAELYHQQRANRAILYTLLSFRTPIAWRIRKGWVLTDQTWGPRTARHQGIARGLRPMAAGSLWCPGTGASVTPVLPDERPYRSSGHHGWCPECGELIPSPRKAIAHHLPGVKLGALR